MTDLERFMVKFVPNPETGCWDWRAGKSDTGYGSFRFQGRAWNAHRFIYEQIFGEVPKGLEINHLCRDRGCVNPAHLEAVTHAENMHYGFGIGYVHSHQTHCINGHEFTPENTYHRPDHPEWRQCRECQRIRNRRRYWTKVRTSQRPPRRDAQPLWPAHQEKAR